MEIKSASLTDRDSLKQLWKISFGDDDKFINDFFDEMFVPSSCIVAKEDNMLAGMLFLLPSLLYMDGKEFSCGYVYGVATAPSFRGRGVMRQCENAAVVLAHSMKLDLLSLVPQNQTLAMTYSRMGYCASSFSSQTALAPMASDGAINICSQDVFQVERDNYLLTKPAFIEFNSAVKQFRFTAEIPVKPLYFTDVDTAGYIVGEQIGNEYIILETPLSLEAASRAAYIIMHTLPNVKRVQLQGICGVKKLYGMTKPISGRVQKNELCKGDIYMKLMLD